ncbi:Hypothetical protein PBC10988_7930 [Planctomycetales bacterium 10988]|nr:Hypothetical protein PBC10988_7930 [Planctomycetales bacterium 10988]
MGFLDPCSSVASEAHFRLRIEWGGGEATPWNGIISVKEGSFGKLQRLGQDPQQVAVLWQEENEILVRDHQPSSYNGFDIWVHEEGATTLSIQLGDARSQGEPFLTEIPLEELTKGYFHRPLDSAQNWLMIRRAPGDYLRAELNRDSLVFSPGESWELSIQPFRIAAPTGSELTFTMDLVASPSGRLIQRFPENSQLVTGSTHQLNDIPLQLEVPQEEGVYELAISANVERLKIAPFGQNWLRETVARRTIQFIVLDPEQQPKSIDLSSEELIHEIDPTSSHWLERLRQWPVPVWRKTSLSHGQVGVAKEGSAKGKIFELGPRTLEEEPAWQAFPIHLRQFGIPHLLEVEIPKDSPQTLGLSLMEPDATGTKEARGLHGGVQVLEPSWEVGEQEKSEKLQTYRFLFWPKTRSPTLIFYNQGQETEVAQFGKIRVYQLQLTNEELPETEPFRAERMLAIQDPGQRWLSDSLAPEALDSWSRRSLPDWNTYYEAAQRLILSLRAQGRNTYFLNVVSSGGTLYPSQVWEPAAQLDPGLLFADGRDPIRKDIVEMLMRMFDRAGMRLVPTIRFATPMPGLEEIRRNSNSEQTHLLMISGENSLPEEADNLRYNPLHPHVQAAMLLAIQEVTTRYAHHRSFAGLGIDMSPDCYVRFPGTAWGIDERTANQFERETGQPFYLNQENGVEQRYQALLEKEQCRERWLPWRSRQLSQIHHQWQAAVASQKSDADLFLLSAPLFDHYETQLQLRQTLPKGRSLIEVLQSVGLDPRYYRGLESPIFLRPHRIQIETMNRPNDSLQGEVNSSTELDRLFRELPKRGVHFAHPNFSQTISTWVNDEGSRTKSLQLRAAIEPAATEERRRIAHSLATFDAQYLIEKRSPLGVIRSDDTLELTKAFRSLPPFSFQSVQANDEPATIRTTNVDGKAVLYVVNGSPWKSTANLKVNAPAEATLIPVSKSQLPKIQRIGRESIWNWELSPFQISAVTVSSSIQVTDSEIKMAGEVQDRLRNRLDELGESMGYLVPLVKGHGNNSPFIAWNLQSVLSNPGFEEKSESARSIEGWKVQLPPGTSATIEQSEVFRGEQSLLLKSIGPSAQLISPDFPAPKTGVFLMMVWMKSKGTRQPRLQLVLEGEHQGKPYSRHAPIGADSPYVKMTSSYRSYLFRVDDLPLNQLGDLRVRLELTDPGEVWIDEVQLSSIVLDPSEMIKLKNSLATARFALDSQRLNVSYRLLQGYWPEILLKELSGKTALNTESNGITQSSPPKTNSSPPKPAPSPTAPTSARWWDPLHWFR